MSRVSGVLPDVCVVADLESQAPNRLREQVSTLATNLTITMTITLAKVVVRGDRLHRRQPQPGSVYDQAAGAAIDQRGRCGEGNAAIRGAWRASIGRAVRLSICGNATP